MVCVCVGGYEWCVWVKESCVTHRQSMDFVLERLKGFLGLCLRHLSINVVSQLILQVCVCVCVCVSVCVGGWVDICVCPHRNYRPS